MLIRLLRKKNFFFILLAVMAGCSDQEYVVEYSMPYVKGCESTISNAERFFSESNTRNDYKLLLRISEFDSGPGLGSQVKGVVTLVSKGYWKTLSNHTPLQYLEVIAKGIEAECMPSNSVSLPLNELREVYSELDRIGTSITPAFRGDRLVLFYNDGSYTNPNWNY